MIISWSKYVMEQIIYTENQSTIIDLKNHLKMVSSSFCPALSERVNIDEYSLKIYTYAIRFEAWKDKCLVGLIACYANNYHTKQAFITNVSILPSMRRKGIAKHLFLNLLSNKHIRLFDSIGLEVDAKNVVAISLYESMGFYIENQNDNIIMMRLPL